MELNFRLDYRTEVVFKEKIVQLDDVFQEEALWVVDKRVLSQFSPPEKQTFVFEGEKNKDLENVESCIEWLIERKATRNTLLVVIGGGATTDFGAFVGSIYNRGLRVAFVPTTILGAVDSSIGGKTAVNFVAKNSIGTFYPVEKVVVVKEFFNTLSRDALSSGKAEMIKVMLLAGKAEHIFKDNFDMISEKSLEKAINDKYSIIADDLDDTLGKRINLNWGHTFGHAIERYYGLSHGLAVANGMVLIQMYIGHLGMKCFSHKKLMQLFKKFDINVKVEGYLKEDGWKRFIRFDKKRDMEEISLVYLEERGCPRTINRNLNDIMKDLEVMR